MSGHRLLPYGDRALLVEVADAPAVVRLVDALASTGATAPDGPVADLVPAARTVLLAARPGVPLAAVRAAADRALAAAADAPQGSDAPAPPGGAVEIPVVYDGPDLEEVARLTGLSAEEVVAAHTGRAWRVAFGGFAPGFAYLVGGDPRLEVPRRAEPRTSVPAGSVGLAGEFSGVYPRSSPGGWQLVGRTEQVLWDLDRDPPALLAPGAEVRFVEAT